MRDDTLPLYEVVGRRPMTDDEIADAIAEYRRHHPGESELQYFGIEQRIYTLNDRARQDAADDALVAEAAAKGLTTTRADIRAAREAKEESDRKLARQQREAASAEVATMMVGHPRARRGPGTGWDELTFRAHWRDALDVGRLPPDAPVSHVAEHFRPLGRTDRGISPRRLQELVDRFGRGH